MIPDDNKVPLNDSLKDYYHCKWHNKYAVSKYTKMHWCVTHMSLAIKMLSNALLDKIALKGVLTPALKP